MPCTRQDRGREHRRVGTLDMKYSDDRRKARRKLRRSHRYAKIGRTKQGARCSSCDSWYTKSPCPCYTEGVQQKMTFEKVYADPGDFVTFDSGIDDAVFELGQNMAKNFAVSVQEMAKLTDDPIFELPPPFLIPSPAPILVSS